MSLSHDHPFVQASVLTGGALSQVTGFLATITPFVVLAYYVFLLLDLPAFKRLVSWIRKRLGYAVLFAAVALVFLAVPSPTRAADDDDAAKWHVGEMAGASAIFCVTAEAVPQVLAAAKTAASVDMEMAEFVTLIQPMGCTFAANVPVRFIGVVDGPPDLVGFKGEPLVIVQFMFGGTLPVFTYLPASSVSDKPGDAKDAI